MNAARHENVRLMVSQLLLNIIRDLIQLRISIIRDDPKLRILQAFFEILRNQPESIIMLMPQEICVAPTVKYRIDACFGGFMVFDYKSSESEFRTAIEDAKSKYLPNLLTTLKVRYYVITNWDFWCIYKIERSDEAALIEVYKGDREGATVALRQIISMEVRDIKIPPHPASIETLFTINSDRLLNELRYVFEYVKDEKSIKPLFEAYKSIMKMLYKGLNDDEVVDLFIKHTLMHMITLASLSAALDLTGDPIDLCSGALLINETGTLDVALPYLNWWKIIHSSVSPTLQDRIRHVAYDVSIRALLVDWKLGGEEDIFRRLYEVLVEAETRRRIGEYYTPLWLVDKILSEFNLKDKLVMDPFCGSGTFLVRAFVKKVMEGENAEKAYAELVGLDVNPLAVAIARAELIISYRKMTGRIPAESPHIYHIDTLAMWSCGNLLLLADPKYSGVVSTFVSHMTSKIYEVIDIINATIKNSPESVLRSISRMERALAMGIRLALMSKGNDLKVLLKKCIIENLLGDGIIEHKFREVIEESDFAAKLAKLIEEYGDSVWAITIVSAAIPSLTRIFGPHIIVTNPPWVPTTEYQAGYVKELRKEATRMLKKLKISGKKAASVITGSDIACIALYKSIQLAKEGVGFVMNREQSFYSESPMRAGILLTYAILKNLCDKDCEVKLIDIDYDAFGHGIYPALVIVKKHYCEGIDNVH